MRDLFINNLSDVDEYYRIIRDEERAKDLKSYIYSLWNIYQPYADRDFPRQFAQDFHARFWEMYLTCKLVSMSLNVVPKQTMSAGPDILIDDSSNRIFLEAITPSEGAVNNREKVRKFIPNKFEAQPVPDTEIILRYTGAITEKYGKYLKYLEQGIITLSDSYIIAINSCKIETAIIDMNIPDDYPRIVKSVLPVGHRAVTINKTFSGSSGRWHHQYRPLIYRSSGSGVTTDIFLRDEYAGISGILYSHSDVANRREDFIFIHNPKSTQNAVPYGYFKFGIEFFVELGNDSFSISREDWRNSTETLPNQ